MCEPPYNGRSDAVIGYQIWAFTKGLLILNLYASLKGFIEKPLCASTTVKNLHKNAEFAKHGLSMRFFYFRLIYISNPLGSTVLKYNGNVEIVRIFIFQIALEEPKAEKNCF